MGDFNAVSSNSIISAFKEECDLDNLIKTSTCFKSKNGTYVDLILTNRKFSFQHSQSFQTGISDFYHVIYTMLKTTFVNLPPKRIKFQNLKKNSNEQFNLHAPFREVNIRGNTKPHVNKKLKEGNYDTITIKNHRKQNGSPS